MMKICNKLMSLILAIATISGCTALSSNAQEKQPTKTVKADGAHTTTTTGLLTRGDKLQSALVGAGIASVADGASYYMDVQEAKLRQRLQGTGVNVVRNGNYITLNLPGNIAFDSSSAELNQQFLGVLDSVAAVLTQYDKTLVEIAGHTDDSGSLLLNKEMSERRAAVVAEYLSDHGINYKRSIVVGDGFAHPIASNATAVGRRQNRRIEITIVPNESRGIDSSAIVSRR